MKRLAVSILSLVLVGGCFERIELESIGFEELLVVESIITDVEETQIVKLRKTSPIGQDTIIGVLDVEMLVRSSEGDIYDFIETEETGVYQSLEPFAGIVGSEYQLQFTTGTGQEYQSSWVEMLSTPAIENLEAEFEPVSGDPNNANAGNFNFFISSGPTNKEETFMRWRWTSTYEIKIPQPSRFLWLGGNDFIAREIGGDNEEFQVEICWPSQESKALLIEESQQVSGAFTRFPVHSFYSETRWMLRGYHLFVEQYALSEESFEFWDLLKRSNQEGGGLFDLQVGSISGNVKNVNDENEPVLGIFEAAQLRSIRRQYHPLDFREAGYLRNGQNFVDCADVDPLESETEEIGEFMEEFGDRYEIGFFVTGGGVFYIRKDCSNCTFYGTNLKPDYWVD